MNLRFMAHVAAIILTSMASEALAQGTQVEVLAEYPAGTFLENLDMLADGRVVFTNYFSKTIELLDNQGKPSTLAQVSAHPVSILSTDDGFLVAAHGQSFVSGPAFVETQQILLLDRDGKETRRFNATNARFLNGMVRHTNGTVLIADSIAGKIWLVDPQARTVAVWLDDAGLAPDPSVKEFRPGANGLKRQGNRLIVSNSPRVTLAPI